MKNKYLLYGVASLIGLSGIVGAGVASAHGMFGGFGGFGMMNNQTPDQIATNHQAMFNQEAQILGISADDVKAAWAKGETMQQLMTEKNISADQVQTRMNDLRTQQLKIQLQALVDKGVITQAQADSRLQATQTMRQNAKGRKGMRGFMGMRF